MVSDMVSLVGKHPQVGFIVVPVVPVFMMYNMLRLQVKETRYKSPSKALSMPILSVIASRLYALYIGIVALLITEHMSSATDIGSALSNWLAAQGAGDSDSTVSGLGGINASPLEGLMHSLPGDTVPVGNADHGFKVNCVSIDNVNYVLRRELHSVYSLVNGLIIAICLHYTRLVVKVKDTIRYIIGLNLGMRHTTP